MIETKIAIIGVGNVGGALAQNFASKGVNVLLGVRDPQADKVVNKWSGRQNISILTIHEAVNQSDIVIVALPIPAVVDVANSIGDLSGKIVIDATNSVFGKPEPYATAYQAFKEINQADVVKCFNTTGFENMIDPVYNGEAIDMFIAGGSEKAKMVAQELSTKAGFGACYDFGGEDKVELIEAFAMSWINLAILQKQGRNMAFRLVKR